MLEQLLDVFGFVSVLLRGGTLAFEAMALGGVAFTMLVLRRLDPGEAARRAAVTSRRVILGSAIALAVAQSLYLAADSAVLGGTTGLSLADVAGANFFVAGSVVIVSSISIATIILVNRPWANAVLPLYAIAILIAIVMTSHAAGRVENRGLLLMVTGIHHAASACWIGAMPYLLLCLRGCSDVATARRLTAAFSRLALISVGVLVGAGAAMSLLYIDSPKALYGTSYGVMVSSKVVLLALLLTAGAGNYFLVRLVNSPEKDILVRIRRLAEVEAGIGFTVILAAASLTSQPPARDSQAGRLTASEIVQRMTPRAPRLETPSLEELSPPTPLFASAAAAGESLQSFVPGATNNVNGPGDIAWSEYNHNWAGAIVLVIGILAVLTQRVRWARHWPLAFLGLAVFLFLRSDPENWPLGPRSFWQSFAVAEVLQHRVFVVMIVAFAIFEWRVQTGRTRSRIAPLVFPAVCAFGGALLLAHAHPLGNVKEDLLAELSHAPLGILAVAAGWSRWLELRMPGPRRFSVAASIWPVCFVLIGGLLLNYRES